MAWGLSSGRSRCSSDVSAQQQCTLRLRGKIYQSPACIYKDLSIALKPTHNLISTATMASAVFLL